jgi:PfaD family protein
MNREMLAPSPRAPGQGPAGFSTAGASPDSSTIERALWAVNRPFAVHLQDGSVVTGEEALRAVGSGAPVAFVPALRTEDLGDAGFRSDHRLRANYVAGAMANGIASVELVEALSEAGFLAFFGAAGLSLPTVETALDRLERNFGPLAETCVPFGVNLIHSPNEPDLEAAVADLFLRRGVRLVEASAYLDLTLPIVRYRLAGIRRGADGLPVVPNRVIAKVSRIEVASKFLAPAPPAMIRQLMANGDLSAEQAELAARVPVASDITAEADSAGHTDNRPALTLLPTLLALRDRLQGQYGDTFPLRVGLGGGIATPAAAAAAFAMGAAYIVTGTVNQACVESGSSDIVRRMLAQAEQADVAMAPAADMFEMGVKVQVLKRGTMFAMRAAKLYEIYRSCGSLGEIPAADRQMLEKTIFRASLDEVWAQTRAFFERRDPGQNERAEREPKHKMALAFRWYLGQSSRWANAGEPSRQIDYQVWCGPAMGAFNEWVRGSFLEKPENRKVAIVGRNLLYGAAVLLRAAQLRSQGCRLPGHLPRVSPLESAELDERLHTPEVDA